jgi:hypothetical protein
MADNLLEAINSVKSKADLSSYDEAATKQTIIASVLLALGWNIFDRNEVFPEYDVEGTRVDFSLRIGDKNLVFIEVKKPTVELDRHKPQLWNYAGWQGVQLAVLTNGVTWWFYLPMLPNVEWPDRKFYAIDLQEQDAESIAARLRELLSKQNVQSGGALKSAQRIHEDRTRAKTIVATLPEAWNKVIGEPDPMLVEIILDATEKLCGFRPQSSAVLSFLDDNGDHILLDTLDESETVVESTKVKQQHTDSSIETAVGGRGGGRISVLLNGKRFDGTSIPTLYLAVLKYVVDNGSISKIEMPWGSGSKRYFVVRGEKPIHKNGKLFTKPVTYKNYHLEAHVNRTQGVRFLSNLCARLGYRFEVVEK